MPRILNAKQAATTRLANKKQGLPEPDQEFVLYPVVGGQQPIVAELGRDGVLATPLFGSERTDHWTLVPGEEEGTYYIKNVESGLFVVEGWRPNPVRVGPDSEEPVAVRISQAGPDVYIIKAPNADVVWTFIPLRPFGHIQYSDANGSPTQLWRFEF